MSVFLLILSFLNISGLLYLKLTSRFGVIVFEYLFTNLAEPKPPIFTFPFFKKIFL